MRFARTADGLLKRSAAPRRAPACAQPVRPKCGPIVTWHWAHHANDCDPWSEPETAWHLAWKRTAARSEVVMRRDGQCHRADLLTATSIVVELQSRYLALDAIAAREQFYGRMVWLYRATWTDRLHFGSRGFWWKHGAKSMASSTRPVFWDLEDEGEIWRVSLGLNRAGTRVLGRVLNVIDPDRFRRWIQGVAHDEDPHRPRSVTPRAAVRAHLQRVANCGHDLGGATLERDSPSQL